MTRTTFKKLPISQYPKDKSPVVLLWNDDWNNPVVGKYESMWLRSYEKKGFYLILPHGGRLIGKINNPTHFSYIGGEGD